MNLVLCVRKQLVDASTIRLRWHQHSETGMLDLSLLTRENILPPFLSTSPPQTTEVDLPM